ncbi:MAG: hypothetical protein K2V38_27985 [Gemmataceae bacterium]|nr:hypothetical protein [Gemmataceae bacterium]
MQIDVINTIGDLCAVEAVPVLRAILKSSHHYVRNAIHEALNRMGVKPIRDSDEVA